MKKSTGVRLKCTEWQGPAQKTSSRYRQNKKNKLRSAPYRSMSIWKQPRNNFKKNWRGKPSYRAKKR
jgi:hypothetical protein